MQARGRTLVVAAIVMVAAAAAFSPREAAAQSGSQAADGKPAKVKRGPSNLITSEEIEAATESNAYELIQRLRPQMLRARGVNPQSEAQGGGIMVYVDNQPMGGLDALNNVQRAGIKQIQYINGTDATQRFGTGHPSGAIIITSKR